MLSVHSTTDASADSNVITQSSKQPHRNPTRTSA
nr:MAG TPA: hypothetical protein [Bacteriophage sp.]